MKTSLSLKRTRKTESEPLFHKLFVPIDFSECSKNALKAALSLANQWRAKIVLIHVAPNLVGGRFLPNTQLQKAAKDQLERLRKDFIDPNTAVEAHIRTGTPFDEIVKSAGSSRSNLIVISTHGYTGLKHVFLGSTAERVIRHAKCPVLVIRGLQDQKVVGPTKFRKILVPTDFSNSSRKSLEYATSFAKVCRAKLYVVHVVEMPMYPDFGYLDLPSQEEAMRRAADGRLALLREKWNFDNEVVVSAPLRVGDAFQEIVNEAKEKKMDLIIMSTHGYTGLDHVLMGSTCEKVVRHASCPVLVTRRR
jgi:nucleotide-binding universal stress UspA family protein